MTVTANQRGRAWMVECPFCTFSWPLRANAFDRQDVLSVDCRSCRDSFDVSMGFHNVIGRYGTWLVTSYGLEHDGLHYAIQKERLKETDWFEHVARKQWCSASDLRDALNSARRVWPRLATYPEITEPELERIVMECDQEDKNLEKLRQEFGSIIPALAFHARRQAPEKHKEDRQMVGDRQKVRLFRDGDRCGVQTTATSGEEFTVSFAAAVTTLMGRQYFADDRDGVLAKWMTQAFEIIAKLRGYKAEVQEDRVLYAGASFVSEHSEVTICISEDVRPVLAAVGES